MVMAAEWTKDMLLFAELACTVREGALTAAERSALAKRFGVSENLLLRYEHAKSTYDSLLFDKQWAQARLEAMRQMNQVGKEILSPELGEEIAKAFYRIRAATPEPENEITHELDEAAAALRAALDAPTSTMEK